MNKGIIIIFFLLLLFPKSSLAQENSESIKSATSAALIDYKLTWPGILPDHPLYKLKVLKDKITAKLITNKVKKIEYDLLMADKTIYASKLLIQKGNISLAKETALKGEHYYTTLVSDYKWAYWYKEKIPQELDKRIIVAALKHQEIFADIAKDLKGEDKKTFENTIYFSKKNYQELEKLKSEDKR